MSVSDRLEQARALTRAGRLDEAVIAVEEALSEAPGHAMAMASLADIQVRRRRLDDAAVCLDKAEAAGGATAFTSRVRGDLCYKAARFAEAARAYSDADALGDRGTWSLVGLARSCLRQGDLEGARGAALRAVEREAGTAHAWTVLGEVAARAGHLVDAEEMFSRAHECAPADQYAYARLVEVRLTRLAPEQRQREVEVLLKAGASGNRHLLGVLARLRSESGDETRAAQAWRQASEADGGSLFARKQEAFALRRAGSLDRAATAMRACLMEDPDDLVLFRTYLHLQRSRDATEELRATLEELLPRAGARRGAIYGELRKLGSAGANQA